MSRTLQSRGFFVVVTALFAAATWFNWSVGEQQQPNESSERSAINRSI